MITGTSFTDIDWLNWRAYIFLSHKVDPPPKTNPWFRDNTTYYSDGWNDVLFTTFYFIVWLILGFGARAFILRPFGRALGVVKPKKLDKFVSQCWDSWYYFAATMVGAWIVYIDGPNYLTTGSLDYLHENWPNEQISFEVKMFILIQLAHWYHVLVVTVIEAKRKDILMMFVHHFVTIGLFLFALVKHYTPWAVLILLNQDVVDWILATLKCAVYIGGTVHKIAEGIFPIFMVIWIITRHFIYGAICYYFTFRFPLFVDLQKHGLEIEHKVISVLLFALEILFMIWFSIIAKMAWVQLLNTIGRTQGRMEDLRSSEEESAEDPKDKLPGKGRRNEDKGKGKGKDKNSTKPKRE